MWDTDVVVAGAGPTGLMLACELRLAGVDVLVLDRLAARTGESRAGGVHPRTMEVLDQRGILDRFLAAGRPMQAGHFSGLRLDFRPFETRYPFTLAILQTTVEGLLEDRAAELGVAVRWSSEVVDVAQDPDGVTVGVSRPHGVERVRARFLVGCDGGRSAVRKLAGVEFGGTPATMTSMLGDVELADPPSEPVFQERRPHGDFSVFAFEPGWYRVMTNQYDRVRDRDAPVSLDELRQALVGIAGTDFGMHDPRWLSRFSDVARHAARYRTGRVLLAGDAAHIHFPAGGQGLNLGVQDAVNLGWKLAAVVRRHAPDELLDTYHDERHPVAAQVLRNTRAQSALGRTGEHMNALREVFGALIGLDEVNRALGGMISALDVRYSLGDGHPLLGRRVPDLDLRTATGDIRMFTLLHAARPVLLDLSGNPELRAVAGRWAEVADHVEARCRDDRVALPVVGEIAVPAAMLVRPDGYVAWVAPARADLTGLRSALAAWTLPVGAGRSGR